MLQYEFMQNAILVSLIIGLILPVIGIIIVLRRLTFIADAFGHINFAGISFQIFLISLVPIVGEFRLLILLIWVILSAVIIEYLRSFFTYYKEVSIIITYTFSISLAMILLDLSSGYSASLFDILFGNINTVTKTEIIIIAVIEIILFSILYFTYKKILLVAIDDVYAKMYGINVKFFRYLSTVFIALAVTIAIKVIGILLVSALVILPLMAAGNIAKNLKSTILVAIVFTELSMMLGIVFGYLLNLSTSAMITIFIMIFYFSTLYLGKRSR